MSAPILDVAAAQQLWAEKLAKGNASLALQLWANMDPRQIMASWSRVAPALFVLVANAQRTGAIAADPYLERIARAQDAVTVTPAAVDAAGFAGVASDGRRLDGALMAAPVQTLRSIGAGVPVPDAMDAGAAALAMVVRSEVADAFRVATQLSMFMRSGDELPDGAFKGPKGRLFIRGGDGLVKPYFRPKAYVRQVQAGACSRCIILAGVRYRRATAFDRHPGCECVHIPVDEDVADVPETDPKAYFDALPRAEQDRVFTKSGAEAIRLGADMNQVVNARRGMYTTQGGLKATRSGTSRRGLFGATQPKGRRAPRLMPEEIIRLSGGDRDTALRLLKQYKFIF